jgi:SAM-dependent methyltransferase
MLSYQLQLPPGEDATMAWYESFFDESYFAEYAGFITPERTARDLAAIAAYLELEPGARILDLCCGHGRHAIELALRGYRVCGQDLSEVFLERARREAEERGAKVEWARGDMRRIVPPPPFDAVISMFTAFGYLENDQEERSVLREVYRVLRPGGRFLIDVVNRDFLMAQFGQRDWRERADGVRVLYERELDALTGVNHERQIWIDPDGQAIQHEIHVRLFCASELRLMLESAGLEVEAAYGGYEGEPLTRTSHRIVIVARRPAGTPS